MQVIQEIRVNNRAIKVYHSVEEPLFDCQEVLIHLLEYSQSNKNRFYHDNKNNEKYITLRIQEGTLSEREGVQKRYFTETGLYRCLFTSQKPIALEFQEQVVQLLKDIRIGNLRLSVQRECESTKLIEEYKDSVLAYVTKNSEIQTQLEMVKNRLEQCSFMVYVYEIEIVSTGELYRGSTIQPKVRSQTHKYSSSCPRLKDAFEKHEQINIYIIGSAKVYNNNERDYFEQQFILAMPTGTKLNKKTPQPTSFDNISQEHIEFTRNAVQTATRVSLDDFLKTIEQQAASNQTQVTSQLGLNIDYSQVNENDHSDYINDNNRDSNFKNKILAVKEFLVVNKFTPRDSDQVTPEERSLGQFLVKVRNAYRNKSTLHYNLSAERYSYAKQMIPSLFDSPNQPFFNRTLQLKAFMQQNNRPPKQRGQNNGDKFESELYDWIQHRRKDYKTGRLPQECLDFITNQVPSFEFITMSDEEKFIKKIQQLNDFYNQHKRFPLQKDDKTLQNFVKTIKSANTNQDKQSFKLTAERKQYVQQTIPNFPW